MLPEPASQELSRQHFARLRWYRRYSHDDGGFGWPLESQLDEYLVQRGYLVPGRHRGAWMISEEGREALEGREVREEMGRKPHQDLARRVAGWLERQGRLAWLNRSFEVFTRNDLGAVKRLGLLSADTDECDFLGKMRYTSRPDVISIAPAERRADYQPWIFEVKVSRRDFYVDVDNPHKRLAYALLAERVYYACPAGLITTDELPVGCGLVVETRRKGVFQVLREPPRCKTRHSAHLNKLLVTSPAKARVNRGRSAA